MTAYIASAMVFLGSCKQHGSAHFVAIAFYNCENFFDTKDDPAKEDEEFTPEGKYHYTDRIYEQKRRNIATVIASMNDGKGPELIGLAEIENGHVLNDLVSQPELRNRHYRYIWYSGPDPRGITVALLYDPAVFTLIGSEAIEVDLPQTGRKARTRDVLYAKGVLNGDTVHVLVNHWPSRIGGVEQSSGKREIAAAINRRKADALLAADPGTHIIVMGDLNDNPNDVSVTTVLRAAGDKEHIAPGGLYDPLAAIYARGEGTEAFRHQWNLFDQIIISPAFLKNDGHLQFGYAEVYKPAFIVDNYKGHEGKPHRSFAGTHWINGYSDHFPVVMYLQQ